MSTDKPEKIKLKEKAKQNPESPAIPSGLKFRQPGTHDWRPLIAPSDADDTMKQTVAESKRALQDVLLTALQMPHLAILAGSGTSMKPTRGPSMGDLWAACMEGAAKVKADTIIEQIRYDVVESKKNIENFLSHCDAYLSIQKDAAVNAFADACKQIILDKCTNFLNADEEEQLEAHETLLHRLSRRRVRDPRLMLFTTNYDLCFEKAAARRKIAYIDGFSFAKPRYFAPEFFEYDFVRRSPNAAEVGDPLEGVFRLLKLHGSVNWERDSATQEVVEKDSPNSGNACLIYPARGKYQQSYLQPHLELMTQYLAALRRPNTCLLVAGFGFNDDHLSEPIISAIKSNPQLRVIIADFNAEVNLAGEDKGQSQYWAKLGDLSLKEENIWFINASFNDFADLLPDLRSLTQAEKLQKALKTIANQQPKKSA